MGKHPTSDASLAEMMESTTLTPQEQAELESELVARRAFEIFVRGSGYTD